LFFFIGVNSSKVISTLFFLISFITFDKYLIIRVFSFIWLIIYYICRGIINNGMNRILAMTVHFILHSKYFYPLHKRHHCLPSSLCAATAWQDSISEFFIMEVFGTFLFSQLIFPLPWPFLVMTAIYNGWGAAIDHSGFEIPNSCISGKYHYLHHFKNKGNYAEIEALDRWFGTLIIEEENVIKTNELIECTNNNNNNNNNNNCCDN